MKRIIPIILIGTLILSGIETVATPEDKYETREDLESIKFSDAFLKESKKNEYITIELKEATSNLMKPGEPIIPIINKKYTFPPGTKINNVAVTFTNIEKQILPKKIIPAPTPIPLISNYKLEVEKTLEKPEIYRSEKLYPKERYRYSIHMGSDGENLIKILNLQCYPVQYSPGTDTIYIADTINIEITYRLPRDPISYPDDQDMVIIAPQIFSSLLKPLIDHKNRYGVRTILETTEDIYNNYEGVDKPEKIKYYIKDAYDRYGIDYVMLIGGMKSLLFGTSRDDCNQGSKNWYVPVRYTNLYEEGNIYDPGYLCDLYYADLYDGEGNFSSWDSNDDGIFAKWSNQDNQTDDIDHYPEVSVGRLACRNAFEVKLIVDKIITYESASADPTWFKRIILVGGDSHNDPGTDYLEGEIVCDKALTYMPDFEGVKLYASNKETSGLTPSPEDLISEISKGAGFLLFDGHGDPGSWNTHWRGIFNWRDTPGGIEILDFFKLKNEEKLPITLIGGCHNSMFNVTLLATLLNKPFMWTYGAPVPECFSWWLTRKMGGGAIAAMGSTGLGYGYIGNYSDVDGDGFDEPDALEGLGGYLEIQFFKIYNEGFEILGDLWRELMTRYLDVFPPMNDKIQMKQIQEWPIIGDPSLKIGGYQ